jgi:hypothetical protein
MNYLSPDRFSEFEAVQEGLLLQGSHADLLGNARDMMSFGLDNRRFGIAARYAAEGSAGIDDFVNASSYARMAVVAHMTDLESGDNIDTRRERARSAVCAGVVGLRMALADHSYEGFVERALSDVRAGRTDHEVNHDRTGAYYAHEVRDRRRIALVESVLGDRVAGVRAARVADKIAHMSARNTTVNLTPEWPRETQATVTRRASLTVEVARLAFLSTDRTHNRFIRRRVYGAL